MITTTTLPKKSRGRRIRNYGFTLPQSETFTAVDMLEINENAKPSDVANFLHREVKANRIVSVGKTRGRKRVVFKLR